MPGRKACLHLRHAVLPLLLLAGAAGALGAAVVGSVEATTFLCRFDGSAAADYSVGSPHPDGVTAFDEGRRGRALMACRGILPLAQTISPFFFGVEYETAGNLHLAEGTIEMWVKPLFDTRVSPESAPKLHYLISSGKYVGELHAFALLLIRGDKPDAPYALTWTRQNGAKKSWAASAAPGWPAGEWHHVAVTYSAKEDVLALDGKAVGRFTAGEPMDFVEETFAVGTNIYNSGIADCLIDDLRLSRAPRKYGSMEVWE